MVDHIPMGDDEPFQDRRTNGDAGRMLIPPHTTEDPSGRRFVLPAHEMVLTKIMDRTNPGEFRPVLRIHASHAEAMGLPIGLAFVPTPDELEWLGTEMVKLAAEMRGAADDLLARTLNKRKDG